MGDDYTRRPEHWQRDLADRGLEMELRVYLAGQGLRYDEAPSCLTSRNGGHDGASEDNTGRLNLPDFFVWLKLEGQERRMALEVKEKKQRYRPRWVELAGCILEPDLLVQDELSARKVLAYSPLAFLLFKDRLSRETPYVVYSGLDLFCLPKRRVNRAIARATPRFKGKWLLSRRDGRCFANLEEALRFIAEYSAHGYLDDLRRLECYGNFVGESIAVV
jgi:hypothetical protein